MKRIAILLLLAACTESKGPITGTQSLELELVSPADPGNVNSRLSDAQRTVVVNIRALDAEGNVDTGFKDRTAYPECVGADLSSCPCKPIGTTECGPVRVYAQFLGTLTPDLSEMPLATISMANGVAMDQMISVPTAYGATTLWVDNGIDVGPDYQFGAVTGTSPTLWYRDPFIHDLQKPRDEMALDALSQTPLSDKQIRVAASRYGERGVLVVTSTFAQGYTISDVECATGLPNPTGPCVTNIGPDRTAGTMDDGYDHVMVFTFSAPRDQFGRPLVEGEWLESFNGGLSEFNGLTEVGFPRSFTFAVDRDQEPCPGYPACSKSLLPTPVVFSPTWFQPLSNPDGRINFERNESGAIEINDAEVCPLDDGPEGVYTRYKQWTIAPTGSTCTSSNVINLITAGTDFTTDPRTLVGQTLSKVVGIVRPVNIGSFNVWIVYPRGKDDIVL